VWNLRVSTPDGVRVNSRFLNAVKYSGPVIVTLTSSVADCWASPIGHLAEHRPALAVAHRQGGQLSRARASTPDELRERNLRDEPDAIGRA
jgi:hypothetical protein